MNKVYTPAMKALENAPAKVKANVSDAILAYSRMVDTMAQNYGESVEKLAADISLDNELKQGKSLKQRLNGKESTKYEIRETDTDVLVSGKEFGEYDDISDPESAKSIKNKAVEYFKNVLQKRIAHNSLLGNISFETTTLTGNKIISEPNGDVGFFTKGRKEMVHTFAKTEKALLVSYLPELIEKCKVITVSPTSKSKHSDSTFYYLHVGYTYKGNKKHAIITVED